MLTGLMGRSLLRAPAPPIVVPSTTVWSPATDFTLTNGNLTAERTSNVSATRQFVRTSAPKTNGRIRIRIDALSGAGFPNFLALGMGDGTETGLPGSNTGGVSVGYLQTGEGRFAANTCFAGAALAPTDVLEMEQSDAVFFFRRQAGGVGAFNLQGSIDTADLGWGAPAITGDVYALASDSNTTGDKVTIVDLTGWA